MVTKKTDVQAQKEEKALELLEKYEQLNLRDDFNKRILLRIKAQGERPFRHWHKTVAALAASIVAAMVIWNFTKPWPDDRHGKIAKADIPVVENLDLLGKMEMLEHLEVKIDSDSSQDILLFQEKS